MSNVERDAWVEETLRSIQENPERAAEYVIGIEGERDRALRKVVHLEAELGGAVDAIVALIDAGNAAMTGYEEHEELARWRAAVEVGRAITGDGRR
jgi:hypothetical protein